MTDVPDPFVVVPPGEAVKVQVPVEGSPFSAALPVLIMQVGCVTEPITGAAGVTGGVLTITFPDSAEVQPASLVTVKVYVPAVIPEISVLDPDPET